MSVKSRVFPVLAALLAVTFGASAFAEQMGQLKVVDLHGKTLSVVEIPAATTATVRAVVADTAGKPRNGVTISLLDMNSKKTIASAVTGTVDLTAVKGQVVDTAQKKEQKTEGAALFSGIAPGSYQLIVSDQSAIVALVEVLTASSTVLAAGAAGAGAAAAGAAGAGAAGLSLGAAAAAVGGTAVLAGGAIAAADSGNDGDGEEAVPTPLPTPEPTVIPTPTPPRPHRPHPPSAS